MMKINMLYNNSKKYENKLMFFYNTNVKNTLLDIWVIVIHALIVFQKICFDESQIAILNALISWKKKLFR